MGLLLDRGSRSEKGGDNLEGGVVRPKIDE